MKKDQKNLNGNNTSGILAVGEVIFHIYQDPNNLQILVQNIVTPTTNLWANY